ncbi:H4MPT-linked C1 transfer pathway protein [Methylophaga sp. 41_12_T18]|nr:H4MPT-linked C1 transfer pathway protein [Methylophaga sp. 41_12_T18]
MTKHASYFSGWDIGGAHVKVARCDHSGKLIEVIQLACPLWKGIEHLHIAIQSAQQQLGNQGDISAITMTGELVDIFADRQTGVSEILACINNYIPADKIHVFASKQWLSPADSKIQWQDVASMNWLASANFVANNIADGLFIDLGSTTCDIIAINNGVACPRGFDDHQRQLSRELLYTGAIRTPLLALTNQAPFNGQLFSLAAEVFATTGDCWRLLNKIEADMIIDDSADGQPWQPEDCARRIARLIGSDADDHSPQQWQQLAQWFAEQQLHQVINACLQVISNHNLSLDAPIIGAGVGRFIAQQCAQRLERPYIDFASQVSPSLSAAADHAPATAIALLAQQQFT